MESHFQGGSQATHPRKSVEKQKSPQNASSSARASWPHVKNLKNVPQKVLEANFGSYYEPPPPITSQYGQSSSYPRRSCVKNHNTPLAPPPTSRIITKFSSVSATLSTQHRWSQPSVRESHMLPLAALAPPPHPSSPFAAPAIAPFARILLPSCLYFSSKVIVQVCNLVADFSLSLRSCISAVCEASVRLLPPTFS